MLCKTACTESIRAKAAGAKIKCANIGNAKAGCANSGFKKKK